MAFGDQRGGTGSFRSNNAISITANFSASVLTGSAINVVRGDLIFAVISEQTAGTTTSMTDNLGNTYTQTNAGSTSTGTVVNGHAFYSKVTVAGTLTAVTSNSASSTHNASIIAAAFEGPFTTPPIDASPANLTNDITSPILCPASGTLSQDDELIIGWMSVAGTVAPTVSAPYASAGTAVDAAGLAGSTIIFDAVAVTTTSTPQWTGGTTNGNVLGTSSFKQEKMMGQAIL